MRFTNDGPSIPDALLNARDENRVVFFCGAGVSRARAKLLDFFGLAEAVIRTLHASEESDARKVLDKARELGQELNIPGLISADRIFGLLEREFTIEDIQAAVAKSLSPAVKVDLSAHEVLLRLAKTTDSKTQLVTTNFDRLFEKCGRGLADYQPPRLPNPSRYGDLDGIVYLHGRVNDEYTGADGDGFVLSSSDFGHAYLSEGWATEFFRDIVRKYVVVFVGYSADDPPIHYLLEGLRRTPDSSCRIYAFQAGTSDETLARWSHKGVEPISYVRADRHRALWDTLEQWAVRADDPDRWRQRVLDLAMNGPEILGPHQRGQVAHIVSTDAGAREEFAERKPPAEWLCVFDPLCRYANPESPQRFDSDDPIIDPFALYGLDSDATPEVIDPNDQFVTRSCPPNAWDAFVANGLDRQNLPIEGFPAVRGHYATHMPRLSKRVGWLGTWIARVTHQPAAIWWAARQKSLHPDIRGGIEWELGQRHGETDPVILKAWRFLLEAWERADYDFSREWYDLRGEIGRSGWSATTVRRLAEITRPYLKSNRTLMSTNVPPVKKAELRMWDLARFEVECPTPRDDTDIPNEWLAQVVRGRRKNIELAVDLCEEVDDSHRFRISPIFRDDRPGTGNYERTRGLSGFVIRFAALFERLLSLDVAKARQEFSFWPTNDETGFCRLRIWAGGKSELVTPNEFGRIIQTLSDESFWSSDHQRDLLLALRNRWKDLTTDARERIEQRLLTGPPQCESEDRHEYGERRAWHTINRIQWLADNNCEFSFDVETEVANGRKAAPTWKPEYANHAADSMEGQAGHVATETEHSMLLRVPINSVLATARQSSGRVKDNFLEERDPFAGLCQEHPRRAYLALIRAARRSEFPEWAWRKFLVSSARESDMPKFSATIGLRLCRLTDAFLQQLLYPSTSWLQKCGKSLSREYADAFDTVVSRLIDLVHLEPSGARSALVDAGTGRDWATAALNSPVGHIAVAILEDSRLEEIDGGVDPAANWLTKLVRLLSLPGDPRRHVIAIISHHLGWFHRLVPEWTERHLLSILDSDDVDDQAAFWAGFFWNPRIPSVALYSRLKPALLELAKQEDSMREGHVQALAHVILSRWISRNANKEERLVSNDELREVLLHGGEEFRSHIIWHFERVFNDDEQDQAEESIGHAEELFRDVWPRQQSVKNPTMSVCLVELLMSNVESFPRLVDNVVPLLTEIAQGHVFYEVDEIVGRYPEKFLSVLCAILPSDVSNWPYGIGDLIEKIGDAENGLRTEERFRELKRRWDAR